MAGVSYIRGFIILGPPKKGGGFFFLRSQFCVGVWRDELLHHFWEYEGLSISDTHPEGFRV